jgi:AraC-like DNA-binding protein
MASRSPARLARPASFTPYRGPLDHAAAYQAVPRSVIAMARDYSAGWHTGRHSHPRAQLIYAIDGVMRVTTPQDVWTLPPLRALWVPPRVDHEIEMMSNVSMRTLYLDEQAIARLWPDCCVIEVSGLLRELILVLVEQPVEYALEGRPAQIAALILSELALARAIPMGIPWPQDRRLLQVCGAILRQPGMNRTVEEWGAEVGASGRTLIRLFQAELGMNYRQWVQRVRLADAVRRLSLGQPVARIAADLGYRSPSAFTAMFRRTLGALPTQYLSAA